jgi:hypothetical protein
LRRVKLLPARVTSENYRGLYQSARQAKRLDDRMLNDLKIEFREIALLPPLAEAMVAIEHAHDRVKAVAKFGWRTNSEFPDLEPAHEALILREHFTELLRAPEVEQRPLRFQDLVRESERACRELEAALREWKPKAADEAEPGRIDTTFARITASCATCHKEFRDVPLGDKHKD